MRNLHESKRTETNRCPRRASRMSVGRQKRFSRAPDVFYWPADLLKRLYNCLEFNFRFVPLNVYTRALYTPNNTLGYSPLIIGTCPIHPFQPSPTDSLTLKLGERIFLTFSVIYFPFEEGVGRCCPKSRN